MRSFLILFSMLFATASYAVEIVKVGTSPVVSSAGIYLAIEKGYFRDQGLEIQLTEISASGGPMTPLLVSGQLDVGAGSITGGLYNAIALGKGTKLVADKGHLSPDRDYIALLVRKDLVDSGRYKSLKDLKGFKMGVTSLDGVSQQIVTDKFLRKVGLTEKDITYVKLTYPEINTALKTKTIDASIQLEPYLAESELDGSGKIVAGGSEVYPSQESAAIIYSPQFQKRRDVAVRFMMAYIQGVRLWNKSLSDPATHKEVAETFGKRLKIRPEVWEKMRPVGLTPDAALDTKSLADDLQWYRKERLFKTDLKLDDMVDLSFQKEAVQRLDKK